MDNTAKTKLRAFIADHLRSGGDRDKFADAESLFMSGRLDSLSLTHLVVYLEDTFGVDFAVVDFETDLVDSVDAIEALVDTAHTPGR